MPAGPDSVARVHLTWRPDAPPGEAERARVAALSAALVEQGLPDGLLPSVPPDEVVCVRRVELPVQRLDSRSGDAELVAHWGRAAARAVSETVAAAGPDVVRYRSLAHARRDLAVGLLSGDRRREWAWRAAGVWPGADDAATDGGPPDRLVARALETMADDEPHAVVGLVAELAREGLLARLVDAAGAQLLARVAAGAWHAVTGVAPPPAAAEARPPSRGREARDGGPVSPGASAPGGPGSPADVVARSAVVRAVRGRLLQGPDGPDVAAALAALAVLDADPGIALGPDAGRVIGELVALLAPGSASPGSASAGPAVPGDRASGGSGQPGSDAPAPALAQLRAGPDNGPISSAADGASGPGGDRAPSPAAPGRAPTGGVDGVDGQDRDTASGPVAGADAAVRDGRTTWGGLLFLLALVADARLPGAVADDPSRFGTQLRPVLHDLGLRLLRRAGGAPAADDAAVLAFAGLTPDAEPPDPAPAAEADLEGCADAVVRRLHDRLAPLAEDEDEDEDENDDAAAVLARVCRRRAVVVADPGWIDVELELDEVDVDVRRAGLDLDLGYLPWLGCVVRFRYG